MGLTKVEACYTVPCDGCGLDFEPGDYIPHYPSEGAAEDDVLGYGWIVWKGHWWGEDCAPACECEGSFREHDYGEGPCEADHDETCKCEGFKPREEAIG